LFVIFNVQSNHLPGVQKNEIDHRLKGIDKGVILAINQYFVDFERVLSCLVG